MVIVSYIVGFLGVLSTFVLYQQKTCKGLLISKLAQDLIWCLYYALIAAWTGVAVAIIAVIRELIFANRTKKWARSYFWLVFFLILSILSGIITWKNAFSVLPCITSALAIISFWIAKPKLSRILSYPASVCMLIYDVQNAAILAIANEIIAISSSIVGNIRYDLRNKRHLEHIGFEEDINKEHEKTEVK